MRNVIFALVAPSGAGKSTLIQAMLERFPDDLGVVLSTTTRQKRPGPEDDLFYRFVDDAEFDRRLAANRFVQHVRYGGNRYGTDRRDIERVFKAGRNGINAFTEMGVGNVRSAGYRVVTIGITPSGGSRPRDEVRAKDDAERAKLGFVPELLFENSFGPGGLEASVNALTSFIEGYLGGLAKRGA